MTKPTTRSTRTHPVARFITALALVAAAGSPAAEGFGLLELFNYYEYSDDLASSGQPTREQYPAVAAAGVEAVINLVPTTDPDTYADEGDVARGLDLDYVHIPINWEAPSRADFEAFRAVMAWFKGKRILVHCYANARASAFVYLWRITDAGHARAEARATMTDIWDWNEGYELENVEQWRVFIESIENALPTQGSREKAS